MRQQSYAAITAATKDVLGHKHKQDSVSSSSDVSQHCMRQQDSQTTSSIRTRIVTQILQRRKLPSESDVEDTINHSGNIEAGDTSDSVQVKATLSGPLAYSTQNCFLNGETRNKVEEYCRIFHAITNCALKDGIDTPELLLPRNFDPAELTESEIRDMRIRFHCAVYKGISDGFCECCKFRPRKEAELRFEAIEVAILVYQEYERSKLSRKVSYSTALLNCKAFLERHSISLSDIETELSKADDLAIFRRDNLCKGTFAEQKPGADGSCSEVDTADTDSGLGSDDYFPASTEDDQLVSEDSKCPVGPAVIHQPDETDTSKTDQDVWREVSKGSKLALSLAKPTVVIRPLQPGEEHAVPRVEDAHLPVSRSLYSYLDMESPLDDLETHSMTQKASTSVSGRRLQSPQAKAKKRKKGQKKPAPGPAHVNKFAYNHDPERPRTPYNRITLANGANRFYPNVDSIPEEDFQTSVEALERINVFYDAGRTLPEVDVQLAEVLREAPSWDRDWNVRCMRSYISQIECEQASRSHRVFTAAELRDKKLTGLGHDRLALAFGKIQPEALVEQYVKIDSRIAIAQQIKVLRAAVYALLDHTLMQFEDRLHIIPERRVSLLDRLKRKLNSIGGRLDLRGYRKAGEGFREVFQHLADLQRRQQHEDMVMKREQLLRLEGNGEAGAQGEIVDFGKVYYTTDGQPYGFFDMQALQLSDTANMQQQYMPLAHEPAQQLTHLNRSMSSSDDESDSSSSSE